MATSWWARLTRWPGVKHPKARGCAGTIALPKGKPRTAGRCICLPACLPGLAWSANRSIPRSDYRGAADTEFCMSLLFRSLSPRPIGFSIFAPCYGERQLFTLTFPLAFSPPLPSSLSLSLSLSHDDGLNTAKVNCARNALGACCKGTAFLRYIGRQNARATTAETIKRIRLYIFLMKFFSPSLSFSTLLFFPL